MMACGWTICSLCRNPCGVYVEVKIRTGTETVHLCTFCVAAVREATKG